MSELYSKPPIFIQAYSEALRSKAADHTQGGAMENHDFKEHFSSLLTESEEHLATLDQFLAERLEQAEINDPQAVKKRRMGIRGTGERQSRKSRRMWLPVRSDCRYWIRIGDNIERRPQRSSGSPALDSTGCIGS